MTKIIFDKEETRNLIMMLQSQDADNHIIAFETLKNVDFNKYVGEILVLYKFGGHKMEYWKLNCENLAAKLKETIDCKSLSSAATLSLITKHKGSKSSIELFMEFFIKDMTKMLESIGYPTDKFEINIKLKDDGQTTKS